jgi:hypothetical protein
MKVSDGAAVTNLAELSISHNKTAYLARSQKPARVVIEAIEYVVNWIESPDERSRRNKESEDKEFSGS